MDVSSVDVPALTKGLSLCVGALVLICCIVFMASEGSYLSMVVGLETMIFGSMQLILETQAPEVVLDMIRTDLPMLLTAPAQAFLSVLTALFLFAMNGFGIAMGVIVLLTVAANAYVLSAYPDAMPQYTQQVPDIDTAEFGGPPVGVSGPPNMEPPYGNAAPSYHYNAQPPQAPVAVPQAPSTADL